MGNRVCDMLDISVNNDVLEFLGIDSNVMLTQISNSDRIYMMCLLKKYYLGLRNRLGIGEDISFGLEMEFEDANVDIIQKDIKCCFDDDSWCVVPDDSLFNGAEINSPVLSDSEDTWKDLRYVCDIVNDNAYVMDNTGAHIHIGVQILGNNPKYWGNFAKLWAGYENIVTRFLYGEYVGPRVNIVKQAEPLSASFIKNIESGRIDDRASMLNVSGMFKLFDPGNENIKIRRKKSVNFTNVSNLQPYMHNMKGNKNTVEFRSPNGTFNPVIWQNNVNLLVKLLLYCKSDNFDEDKIIRRIKQISEDGIASNIFKYSRIYTEQAIELADMIFDNNLDKVYFLRQYIKSGEVSTKSMVKSRKFTK